MSPRTNLSLAVLVLLAVFTLFATPGEAEAVLFRAPIDWLDEQNVADGSVTMVVRTYDQWGVMLDEEEMFFENRNGVISRWGTEFVPNAAAVRWEVEIWPKSMFDTSIIVDGDDVNHQGDNVLNDPFVYGQ